MNVWTILFALVACAAIVVGCMAVSVFAIGIGVVYLISVVGIWTGKPEKKWYLIAVFIIALGTRLYALLFNRFAWLDLVFVIVPGLLATRFIMWKPPVRLPNHSPEPTPDAVP